MKLLIWIVLLSALLLILIPSCSEAFRARSSCTPARTGLLAEEDIWRLEEGVNLFDFGSKIPLIICWKNQIVGERSVDDLVNLNDPVPTFLEFAHLKIPNDMTAKSLSSILFSGQSEYIESDRKFVLSTRENHTLCRKYGFGYPARSVRTYDYLYIRNCEPERRQASDPLLFGDVNTHTLHYPSPTKVNIPENRNNSDIKFFYNPGFVNSSAEEINDLRLDPIQITNIPSQENYASIKKNQAKELDNYLDKTKDAGIFDQG